jgi:lipoprotein NlpI
VRLAPVFALLICLLGALSTGCDHAENSEEKRLAALQSKCSSLDKNYNEANVQGCTAFLAERSLDPLVRAYTLNIRGNTYDALKQFDLAISDYFEAVKIQPSFYYGYGNIGLEYCRKGNFGVAVTYFDRALAQNPSYSFAMYGRGVALSWLDRPREAEAQLAAANAADPQMASVFKEIVMEPKH